MYYLLFDLNCTIYQINKILVHLNKCMNNLNKCFCAQRNKCQLLCMPPLSITSREVHNVAINI